ncbi:hypothetical protein [Burkholderia sp. Ac-20384]|uniref:hypothetical protein n=1 Tax=Burkholderia sp. Ac-20384 TaxID=2703902 RepID=UPI0019818AD9|nr:hypothetical protein [Burkholderia sp. Ac-20384]
MKFAMVILQLTNRGRQKVVWVAFHDPLEQSVTLMLGAFPLLLHLCRRMRSVFGIPEGCVDVWPIPAGHWARFEEQFELTLKGVADEVTSQYKVEADATLPEVSGGR